MRLWLGRPFTEVGLVETLFLEEVAREPEELDLRLEFDAISPPNLLSHFFDKGRHVLRCGAAPVHNEVGVLFGHLSIAAALALQTSILNELANRFALGIHEDAAAGWVFKRLAFLSA